jgi:hypothetical protein
MCFLFPGQGLTFFQPTTYQNFTVLEREKEGMERGREREGGRAGRGGILFLPGYYADETLTNAV